MILLSIDPGLRACGCALFKDGRLTAAALVKNTEKTLRGPVAHLEMAWAVRRWVCMNISLTARVGTMKLEFPRVYPNHSNKRPEDPNDLLELAGVDGALATSIIVPDLSFVFPSDWKGQAPKKVMNDRVIKTLFPEELAILTTRNHNVLDGVGIGLHHLGRLQ